MFIPHLRITFRIHFDRGMLFRTTNYQITVIAMHRHGFSGALRRTHPSIIARQRTAQLINGYPTFPSSARSYSDEPPSKSTTVLKNLVRRTSNSQPGKPFNLAPKSSGPSRDTSAPRPSGALFQGQPKVIDIKSLPRGGFRGGLRGRGRGPLSGGLGNRGGTDISRPEAFKSLDGSGPSHPGRGPSSRRGGFRGGARRGRGIQQRVPGRERRVRGTEEEDGEDSFDSIDPILHDLKSFMTELEFPESELEDDILNWEKDEDLGFGSGTQQEQREWMVKDKIKWLRQSPLPEDIKAQKIARYEDELNNGERAWYKDMLEGDVIDSYRWEEDRELATVTPFEPEVSVDDLKGWMPSIATSDSHGLRESAMRSALILGGGQPYDSTEYRDTLSDYKRIKSPQPLFFNTIEEKEHFQELFKGEINVMRDANDTTKMAITDNALRGIYEEPKPAKIDNALALSRMIQLQDGTYQNKDIDHFEEKLRSLLPQTRKAWIEEQKVARSKPKDPLRIV